MRYYYGFVFIFLIHFGFGQEQPNVTDSISLQEAIVYLEASQNIAFYYRPEWIVDVWVSKEHLKPELPKQEALSWLLRDTKLNYFIDDDRVILLLNTKIFIPDLIGRNGTDSSYQFAEILFTNETTDNYTSNKVVVVGDIKKFHKGKSSVISGQLESENGPLEGVYIYSVNNQSSAISDEQGRFNITLINGINELQFQSVSTIPTTRKVNVYSDGDLKVKLDIDVLALDEIVISAEREMNINNPQMGLTSLESKQLSLVPTLLGEKDIIRVATTTAGVQNVGEGSAGINIRGGKADQNLFLLDNFTVFTTHHFFGFFSAFNSRGIATLSLYKNGIPVEYGGRLSSVFAIQTKDPNDKKLEVKGGIGLVTSQLQAEGPIDKLNTTLLANFRGTYSQYILNEFKNSTLGNNQVSFYDFTVKSITKLGDKDELSIIAYHSNDAFKMQSDTLLSFSNFTYSNHLIGANWKHTYNNKLFSNIEIGNSNFNYRSSYEVLPTQAFNIDLFVNELRGAFKFDYYINENIIFKLGIELKFMKLNPGKKSPIGSRSLVDEQVIDQEKAMEFAPYFSTSYLLSEKLAMDLGIRYSLFNSYGPATINMYRAGEPRENASIIGTQRYRSGELMSRNHGPEFRLQGRYLIDAGSSLKMAYGRTRQNIHLLLNSASIAPTDVWRLSGPFIDPQTADQFSIGYYKNFYGKNLIEFSAETYYKSLNNLLDFKTGAELLFNQNIETDLLQGVGQSYGIEFSLAKKSGWLSGWLNYTYSRSFVRLRGNSPSETVNGGVFYPTGYDKPHYFNSVTNYKFTSRITITIGMIYSSGIPITYPVGKWNFKSSENILYSDRNEFRIPNYFRADLGFNVDASHKLKRFTHSSWTFAIYNLLGRDNIYSIFFEVVDNEVRGYKMSIFPNPIPTITYNFRF